MTIALVQQVAVRTTGGGANPKVVTIATPGAGNALRLCVTQVTGFTVTAVTGGGVTWTKLAEIDTSDAASHAELWGGDDSSGSGTTVSITLSSTYGQVNVNVSEWSGLDTAPVQDPAPSTNTGTSITITASTVTPTAGKEVLLLAIGRTNGALTDTPSDSFTALARAGADTAGGYAYRVVASASGGYQTTWPNNAGYQKWATIVAGWDAAGGGGGNRRRRVILCGSR
jgi:hypothetical protein